MEQHNIDQKNPDHLSGIVVNNMGESSPYTAWVIFKTECLVDIPHILVYLLLAIK